MNRLNIVLEYSLLKINLFTKQDFDILKKNSTTDIKIIENFSGIRYSIKEDQCHKKRVRGKLKLIVLVILTTIFIEELSTSFVNETY